MDGGVWPRRAGCIMVTKEESEQESEQHGRSLPSVPFYLNLLLGWSCHLSSPDTLSQRQNTPREHFTRLLVTSRVTLSSLCPG